MMDMKTFRVEYRCSSDRRWGLDAEFESLGEAMQHLTSEALCESGFDHRLVQGEAVEIAHIKATKGIA